MMLDIVAAYVLAGFAFVLLIHPAIEAIETDHPVIVRLVFAFAWPVLVGVMLVMLLMVMLAVLLMFVVRGQDDD